MDLLGLLTAQEEDDLDLLVFDSIATERAVLSVRSTDSKIPIGNLIALNRPTCPISIYSRFLRASTPRVCLDM
jgi:hypothetical protein